MSILINIDVPDLAAATAFYTAAFGLSRGRRIGEEAAELLGWPSPVYVLQKAEGSCGAGRSRRGYDRHWTPVHLDVVVDCLDVALERALAAGAKLERATQIAVWGKIAGLADPFGHGFCLIEFRNRGYDELVSDDLSTPGVGSRPPPI